MSTEPLNEIKNNQNNEDKHKKHISEENSPSGKYKLIIVSFENISRCDGSVIDTETDSVVYSITRNYSIFHHSWITKNKQEYLQTGRNPSSKLIINLETGEEFESKVDEQFCWAESWLSSDGNTLAVLGCQWATPYEYRFYDFTDPKNEWVLLKYLNGSILSDDCLRERYDPVEYWVDDDKYGHLFVICETKEYVKYKNRLIDKDEDPNLYDIVYASGDEHSDDSDYWDHIDNNTIRVISRCTKFRRDGDQIQTVEDNHYNVYLTDPLNKNHYCHQKMNI